MSRHENKLIITYTAEDEKFTHSQVMEIAGRENAGPTDLGTIVAPMPAGDVHIDIAMPDPVVFSYTNTEGGKVRLRVLLAKIESTGGGTSACTFTVLVPVVGGDWITLTKDVEFVLPGTVTPAVRNPHGVAETDGNLYIIDYENRHIAIVNIEALEAAAYDAKLEVQIQSVSRNVPADAHGQSIVIVGSKLYALFLRADTPATAFDDSELLRLNINGDGSLTYETKTIVGKNAQSIIPVINNGVVWLLVPAIGGRQLFDGATNGTESNICAVEALGDWEETPVATIITSDVYPPSAPTKDDPTPAATAFNIIALGAGMRSGASWLYILTQVYINGAKSAFWELYRAKVGDFLAITGTPTLSAAAADTQIPFESVDEGYVQAPTYSVQGIDVPYGVYFWDLLYEQSMKDDEEEDRLWIALGSPILVTKPNNYGSPNKPGGLFAVYSCVGGGNVNAADVSIETYHQAKRDVSLKRGLRGAVSGRE